MIISLLSYNYLIYCQQMHISRSSTINGKISHSLMGKEALSN